MTHTRYAAQVTLSHGHRSASLGGVTARNRRLVLLWLRRQALRLANGHGCGGTARDAAPNDVRPVLFRSSDAPEGLRFWATDGRRQDDAIRTLEAGFPLQFTVLDPAVELSLTLAGWHSSPAGHP
ncbi:hypothetical protein RM717_19965 [Streptomyces griseus]|uniref:Uncharacterized protein n=1 Tax=Streptomyces stephensoniae TaxID=3375367 RepID=A0ABU2W4J4_9ACTN|nr:hypothetical protein [Streptomyces griseus]MDT0492783.1 hypothetical protein [Streptomyces griseus]